MFHADGCVKPNILLRPYQVVIIGDCEHTKIVRMEITIMAETYHDAVTYAEKHLCPTIKHHVVGRMS